MANERASLPKILDRLPRSAPIRVFLAVLALLSLSGVGWLSYRELARASNSRDNAASVQMNAQHLVDLADLRVNLLDEHNWNVTVTGIAELGISNDTIVAITGIDAVAELDQARAAVDRASKDDQWVGARIDEIRSDTSGVTEKSAQYLSLEEELQFQSDTVKREMEALAGDAFDGGMLVARVHQLVAAIDARQAVASQLATYFTAQFGAPEDLVANLDLLMRQHIHYEDAMSELVAEADPGTETAVALRAIAESSEVEEFGAANSQLIEMLLASGASNGELTNAVLFGNLDAIQRLFDAGDKSSDLHLGAVVSSQRELEEAVSVLRERAASQTTATLWTVSILTLTSLVATAVLARFIGRPLRRLADRARQLRDGETVTTSSIGGPREVRLADVALCEAAANLDLIERQTIALANSELDNPVMAETVPGGVGAALQKAVRHLAESLSEREEFRQQLAYEATHDGLTQLPNRRASLVHLRQSLARTVRSGNTLALLFLDLDGFKLINDHHGHQAGDQVLRVLGRRLLDTLRDGDHVGRFGGDEFLVVAEPVTELSDVVFLAERLIERLQEPIDLGHAVVQVNACVGISLAHDDRLTVDELLRDADFAVYQAKAQGPGVIEVCDAELKAGFEHQVNLRDAISTAITDDELTFHYQPIVDATTHEPQAVEALLRWSRPDHGLVAPHEFIPFAEGSDLLIDMDRWAIETGVTQLAAWAHLEILGAVPLAVNVSSRSIGSDLFDEFVLEQLVRHDVEPSRLILEITESALLSDLDGAAICLDRLRSNGVSIAIDDFGTGYSSLSSLSRLPFDILKVDQSCTVAGQSDWLVQAIIETGHLLGARIVAEGVEDAAQASRLAALGSDELQGYFFGKPCPPDELRLHLSKTSEVQPLG